MGDWETARFVQIKAPNNESVEGGDITAFISFALDSGDIPNIYERLGVSMEVNVQDDEPGGLGFAASDIYGPGGLPDGKVNLLDLAKMADEWLSCTDPSQTP
jgi:hypothetical protein